MQTVQPSDRPPIDIATNRGAKDATFIIGWAATVMLFAGLCCLAQWAVSP
jgi:hypothetical protein